MVCIYRRSKRLSLTFRSSACRWWWPTAHFWATEWWCCCIFRRSISRWALCLWSAPSTTLGFVWETCRRGDHRSFQSLSGLPRWSDASTCCLSLPLLASSSRCRSEQSPTPTARPSAGGMKSRLLRGACRTSCRLSRGVCRSTLRSLTILSCWWFRKAVWRYLPTFWVDLVCWPKICPCLDFCL